MVKDFSLILDNFELISASDSGKKACREYIDAVMCNENVKIDEAVAMKLKELF